MEHQFRGATPHPSLPTILVVDAKDSRANWEILWHFCK